MIKTGKSLKKRRVFSDEFKKARVQEYEKGEFTVKQIAQLYHVSDWAVYLWIYKYSTYNKKQLVVVESSKSSQQKLKELQAQVKELQRVVGQKQLHIDYLEKMMEIAKEEYQIDIKKNSDTPQSTGTGKTNKNQG